MSLRTDIHSAFDEVAPSTFGLPERVVETLASGSPGRPGRNRWLVRLRTPLSLVAMFVLLAVVAAVLVGGRVVQDWNAFRTTAPAGGGPSELAQLQARPMQAPLLRAGEACPETPLNPGDLFPSGLYGAGPTYIAGGSSFSDTWGTYWLLAAVTTGEHSGLLLVRGQDLRTGQPVIFVGSWASGPVLSTDLVNGKQSPQRLDLVLDRSHPPQNMIHAGTVTWGFTAGLAKGSSGCTAWQLDTTDGTELIVTGSIRG